MESFSSRGFAVHFCVKSGDSGGMRSIPEALGRLDPLIESIVGDHHEDEIDDDAKQFAAHALDTKWIRAVDPRDPPRWSC